MPQLCQTFPITTMVATRSWGDLTRLIEQARSVTPVALIALVQQRDGGRASVLHTVGQSVVQCVASIGELPEVLRPTGADLRQVGPEGLETVFGSPVGWFPRAVGARRLVSVGVPGSVPAARLYLATSRPEVFTADQEVQLQAVAAVAGRVLADVGTAGLSDGFNAIDRTGELLGALLRVLDVREVFDRVSETAVRALPGADLQLRLFSTDLERVESHISSSGRSVAGSLPAYAKLPALARVWDCDLSGDCGEPSALQDPVEAPDARSFMRLLMRFDDRVIGDLTFTSPELRRFGGHEVAIGRRLADHAAVALSYSRVAEESRRAVALQERATNLEVLDGLLATLTGVLDVREVFDRVSAIAQKVLPHDAMSISEIIDNDTKVRIHASYGLGQLKEPYDIVAPDTTMVVEQWDYRLLTDVRNHPEYATGPGWAAGMRCMLFVSIRLGGRNFGGLNFYSRTVGHFVRDDVLVARRITDHVALALSHRRLADEARKSEELRARTTSLELLDELLAAVVDTGDLPAVLTTISSLVRRVLPHDAAAIIVKLSGQPQARVLATTGLAAPVPESTAVADALLARADWEHEIVDDLTHETAPLSSLLAGAGCRSSLRVPIRLDRQFTGSVALLANAVGAFQPTDVLVARRMADRLTVTLARDREVAASQRADEATARAARLEARVKSLTEELDARTGFRRVLGESPQWRRVLTQAAQVAATDATVLLLGESGTGKEVVARFLHRGSARKGGPFVALNCAALPEQLLEAELFGYERGAYTGATQSKPGQLEQASGGTLFLDEVAEMSVTAQPKFLRVLQEREFQRLGGTRVLRTDARIVAATNRDLQRSIANGHFREDLFYRLNVFTIHLPALRDRRDDILPLSEALIEEIGAGIGRPPAGISRDARQMLLDYHWPGNVRELRNALERAAILSDGGLITADLLALNVTSPVPERSAPTAVPIASEPATSLPPAGATAAGPADSHLSSVERAMIERALQNAKFNKSKAAKTLGLTRHQLYIRLRKYGFE
jgi:transcriptional regulator with GAF, ATPase, and Fis domain